MTKEEQATFVRNLAHAVAENIVKTIEKGVVPDYWDGFELREWLAEDFARESLLREPRHRGRLRKYRNDGSRFAWK